MRMGALRAAASSPWERVCPDFSFRLPASALSPVYFASLSSSQAARSSHSPRSSRSSRHRGGAGHPQRTRRCAQATTGMRKIPRRHMRRESVAIAFQATPSRGLCWQTLRPARRTRHVQISHHNAPLILAPEKVEASTTSVSQEFAWRLLHPSSAGGPPCSSSISTSTHIPPASAEEGMLPLSGLGYQYVDRQHAQGPPPVTSQRYTMQPSAQRSSYLHEYSCFCSIRSPRFSTPSRLCLPNVNSWQCLWADSASHRLGTHRLGTHRRRRS
ncbi:hypothetical protein OBBRIDRAFT_357830 [Obba rivulosa]|uniref:Uncharacterized protein n=1 Tax=Obba rivulosa TaxID=1052685 RepID=A0A8E2AMC1_9APHY|nr:hypothetical protein OBBRIDRAFT_357830 [Obba rivulosa]